MNNDLRGFSNISDYNNYNITNRSDNFLDILTDDFNDFVDIVNNYIRDKKPSTKKKINNYISKLKQKSMEIKNILTIRYLCDLVDDLQKKPSVSFVKEIEIIFYIFLQVGIDPDIFLHPEYSLRRCLGGGRIFKAVGSSVLNQSDNDAIENYIENYNLYILPIAKKMVNKFYNPNNLRQKMPQDLVEYTKSFLTGIEPINNSLRGIPHGSPRMGFRRSKGSKSPRKSKIRSLNRSR